MHKSSNVVLIGMPGAGKSTVGVILSKQIGYDFIDTDIIIQSEQGETLQTIVDRIGYAALRHIEEEALLRLSVQKHIIATGGSAVYSDAAMQHLKTHGTIVFLDVRLDTLEKRVSDYTQRGLAKAADQSIIELYEERLPLYRQYADISIQCDLLDHDAVSNAIVQQL